MPRSKLAALPPPPGLVPNVLGLRLLKLPMGVANPLVLSMLDAGARTEIYSALPPMEAMMAAALSRTDGTDCSNCSVVLGRGCGAGFVDGNWGLVVRAGDGFNEDGV